SAAKWATATGDNPEAQRSGPRTNTSVKSFVSLPTRLVAPDGNATKRPSAEIAGSSLNPFPCPPEEPTLIRLVLCDLRSRRKSSVSCPTRLVAPDAKATKRPSAEIEGAKLRPSPCTPAELRLTRLVFWAFRSRTKTSSEPLVSLPTRLVAAESKPTKRPSAEI